MPASRPLADDVQDLIMLKHQKGDSPDQIAQMLELTKAKVTNVIKKKTGVPTNQGRKFSLPEHIQKFIAKSYEEVPEASMGWHAQQVEEKFQVKCNDRMVDRLLQHLGLKISIADQLAMSGRRGIWVRRATIRAKPRKKSKGPAAPEPSQSKETAQPAPQTDSDNGVVQPAQSAGQV